MERIFIVTYVLCVPQVEQTLISVSDVVKAAPKADRTAVLRAQLRQADFQPKYSLPLTPKFVCAGIVFDKCKCMDSNKAPLWLVWLNADPLLEPQVVTVCNGR